MINKVFGIPRARFGSGTVRIKTIVKTSKHDSRLVLSSCKKTKIGDTPPESKPTKNLIILEFSNVESIDVLIQKLKGLKDGME